jgi:hypothetical protein
MNCHQALFFLQQFRNIGTCEHAVTELKKEGIRGENGRKKLPVQMYCVFKLL